MQTTDRTSEPSHVSGGAGKARFAVAFMACVLLLLLGTAANAQTTYLVKDLVAGSGTTGGPTFLTDLNGTLFFRLNNQFSNGAGLWKSDGSPGGTVQVTAQTPVRAPVAIGNLLFFTPGGAQVWKTDGTSGGTVLIKDLVPGDLFARLNDFANFNGTLLFTGADKAQVWKSDGTEAGTVMLKNLGSGFVSNARGPAFVVAGGRAFFSVCRPSPSGCELWGTDGTPSGTVLLRAFGQFHGPDWLVASGARALFQGGDDVAGDELWISDGTPGGTLMVKDVEPGLLSSSAQCLYDVNGTVFFYAFGGYSGHNGLWKTDGSSAGTVQVHPTVAVSCSMTNVNGTVFFAGAAGYPGVGTELWKSTGTTPGTSLVKDINPSGSSMFFTGAGLATGENVSLDGRFWFRADNGTAGTELWVSDGSASGTNLVTDIYPGSTSSGPNQLTTSGGNLYFVATDVVHGRELWTVRLQTAGLPIFSFAATNVFVSPGGASTLSWSVTDAATVTLNGTPVSAPAGSLVVNPTATTTYTLSATDGATSASRTVTVFVNDGTASLGTPTMTAPTSGQTVVVTGVGFAWTAVGGATGYDLRVFDGSTGAVVFSGSLLGSASISTLISLPAGSFRFAVRACSAGFAASQCGSYGTVPFTVSPAGPSAAPTVTFPAQSANLTSSTQTLSWTAVAPNPALSGLTYEVLLRDITAGTTALQITVPSPTLSTIFTMKSSTQYELKVRACQAGCGPYSTAVTFAVSLPAVPTGAPTGVSCSVSGGNSLTCNWNAVVNADAYQLQVVQAPPAGPGGGALTAAARQVSATSATLPVPAGAATVFIAACNGNGCGPNATTGITAAGPNPPQANIGTPMTGTVVAGPGVLFTWNRVPGDTGSNTSYRLFVQDLSRQATALDVFTTSNFYSAYFKAEGARYDALVVSNPGLPSQATGPSLGFNVAGSSATSPTMVSPPHNGVVSSGNIQLGWSPVPGATLYEYFVAVLGQGSASASGVTPGLLAQVPLTGSGGGTVFSGIVRACPSGATCVSGSETGWGPWSNAPGGPGVTNFTVVP